MIEEIGRVHHNKKGQYFVQLKFVHEGTRVEIDCQLDTGATCNVVTHQDVYIIQLDNNPGL